MLPATQEILEVSAPECCRLFLAPPMEYYARKWITTNEQHRKQPKLTSERKNFRAWRKGRGLPNNRWRLQSTWKAAALKTLISKQNKRKWWKLLKTKTNPKKTDLLILLSYYIIFRNLEEYEYLRLSKKLAENRNRRAERKRHNMSRSQYSCTWMKTSVQHLVEPVYHRKMQSRGADIQVSLDVCLPGVNGDSRSKLKCRKLTVIPRMPLHRE